MQADIGSRDRTPRDLALGIERRDVLAELMLRAQRIALGFHHVVGSEHGENAVADQFQHVPAGLVNRVDGRFGIIVEEGDDLVRANRLADPRRIAKVGEPQHRLDALGDAARDPATQHLLRGVTAEIDTAKGACDLHLRDGLQGQAEQGDEFAQRRHLVFAETSFAARRPVRIDAVHVSHGALFAEPVQEHGAMPVAIVAQVLDHVEPFADGRIEQVETHLAVPLFQHVEEHRATPGFRRIARGRRAIFEHLAFIARPVAPAKTAPFEQRMQRVEKHLPARQLDPHGEAALAEAADQLALRRACKALAGEPVHQFNAGGSVHLQTFFRHDGLSRQRCRSAMTAKLRLSTSHAIVPRRRYPAQDRVSGYYWQSRMRAQLIRLDHHRTREQTPDQDVEDRREDQAEDGDADHAEEHGHADRLTHFRAGA